MTPEAAPQTAENPTDTPMHYDSERGMYVPGSNSGNIVNFNPSLTQNVGTAEPKRIEVVADETPIPESPPPVAEPEQTPQTSEIDPRDQRILELETQLAERDKLIDTLTKKMEANTRALNRLAKALEDKNKVEELKAEPEPEPQPSEPAVESGSPTAEDEGMGRMETHFGMIDTDEDEKAPEPNGGLRKRLRDIWNWAKNPSMWGAGTFNRIKNAGVGRDQEGRPIVTAVPGERPPEQPKTDEEKRKSRWWLVAIPLGALAAYGTYKAFQQGMDVPFFGDGNGGEVPEIPAGPEVPGVGISPGEIGSLDIANDTIYAKTPQEFISGAFDLIGRQGIQAHGVTPEKINALVDVMKENHWQIVSGMQNAPGGGLEWHTVDAAADWADGYTSNYRASAAQGFPGVGALRRFMETAANQGVTFTRG